MEAVAREPEVLSPPDNFGIVEHELYRSAVPTAKHLPYVRTLRLRTLLLLCNERVERALRTFCDEHAIALQLHALPSLADEQLKTPLQSMLCAQRRPLLLCDAGGVHEVGVLVACLRRVRAWNLTSVLAEYRLFAGARRRYAHELFVELFDVELINVPRQRAAALR